MPPCIPPGKAAWHDGIHDARSLHATQLSLIRGSKRQKAQSAAFDPLQNVALRCNIAGLQPHPQAMPPPHCEQYVPALTPAPHLVAAQSAQKLATSRYLCRCCSRTRQQLIIQGCLARHNRLDLSRVARPVKQLAHNLQDRGDGGG